MVLTKRFLGKTGYEVTFVGFGALEIGRDWGLGDASARAKPEELGAASVLNGALDLGLNLIDTARAYHYSEERIGQAISSRRQEYVLASKCGEHTGPSETCYYDFGYQAIHNSIDLSLKLLQTDFIDVMQIHFGPEPDKVLDEGQTVRAMREAKESGKVKFLNASPPQPLIERCINLGIFDVLQVSYSLLDRSTEDLIARAADQGIGILVRSGLGKGLLTPRVLLQPELMPRVQPYLSLLGGDIEQLPALALAFLRRNTGVSSVLVGTRSLKNLQANVAVAEAAFDPDILEAAMRVGH